MPGVGIAHAGHRGYWRRESLDVTRSTPSFPRVNSLQERSGLRESDQTYGERPSARANTRSWLVWLAKPCEYGAAGLNVLRAFKREVRPSPQGS